MSATYHHDFSEGLFLKSFGLKTYCGTFLRFVVIPFVFFYTPPEAMPEWLRLIMYLSPLYYYRNLAYGVMLKGVGLESLWPTVMGMLILGAALFFIALWRYEKQF